MYVTLFVGNLVVQGNIEGIKWDDLFLLDDITIHIIVLELIP